MSACLVTAIIQAMAKFPRGGGAGEILIELNLHPDCIDLTEPAPLIS